MSQRKINSTKRTIVSGQARATNDRQGLFAMLEKDSKDRQVDKCYLRHKPYSCDLKSEV